MKKYGILLVVLALLGGLFYNKVFVPKHTFKVVTLQSGSMGIDVQGIGNVGAKDIYKIGSIYGGKILNLNVQEGEFIKKGTLIATIDWVDLQDKIDELKATKQKISSDIISLKVDKQSAISSYEYQLEIFKKNKKLYKKGAISELDFKKYQTNKDVAKLKISSLEAKISSLNNQSLQLLASINGLKERLARYEIYAPISGYVTKKTVANYQIIMPNQTLVEIVNPQDVWIKTYIDTRISGKVKQGDDAIIVLQSSSKQYKGVVANIKPITNSITYEREVDVSFKNLPIPFYLDEQARVTIKIGKLNDIVKIPNMALTVYKEKEGVWILKDNNKVEFKEVKILTTNNKFAASKDISQGVKVVIPNPNNKALTNGMKINPVGKTNSEAN